MHVDVCHLTRNGRDPALKCARSAAAAAPPHTAAPSQSVPLKATFMMMTIMTMIVVQFVISTAFGTKPILTLLATAALTTSAIKISLHLSPSASKKNAKAQHLLDLLMRGCCSAIIIYSQRLRRTVSFEFIATSSKIVKVCY